MAKDKLDDGFEEVPLDEGFEEVSLDSGFEEVSLDEGFEETPKQVNVPIKRQGGFKDGSGVPEISEESKETAEDLMTGAGQGLSWGSGDELVGGVQASFEKLKGSDTNFKDLYEKYRNIQRDQVKAAEERSPIATTIGDIVGSLAPMVLTGGAGILGKGVQVGSKEIGKRAMKAAIAKGFGTEAAKGIAKNAARKQLVKKGLEFSIEGGIQSAGRSEGETIPEVINDTYEGAKTGLAVAGAIGAVGKTLGKATGGVESISDGIADTQLGRQTTKAFSLGEEGINIGSGKKTVQDMTQRETSEISNITNGIFNTDSILGKELVGTIESATNKGVVIDAAGTIDEAAAALSKAFKEDPDLLGQSETLKIVKQLFDLQSQYLSPKGAYELMERVQGLKTDNSTLKNVINRFDAGIKTALKEQVEGYASANSKFAKFREAVPESIINRGDELSTKMYGSLSDNKSKFQNELKGLLDKLNLPGAQRQEQEATISLMQRKLNELVDIDPSIIKTMGYDSVNDFIAKLNSASDVRAINDLLLSATPGRGLTNNLIDSATSIGKGLIYKGANTAGKVSGSVRKTVKPITDLGRSIYKAGDERLSEISAKFMENDKLRPLGNVLKNAIENKGSIGKKAALFTIMQNPDARKALEDFDFGLDTPEDGNE